MQAIKDFVLENGFDYDYYADGGMTQNEEGYWQTPDAVSGATVSSKCILKAVETALRQGG